METSMKLISFIYLSYLLPHSYCQLPNFGHPIPPPFADKLPNGLPFDPNFGHPIPPPFADKLPNGLPFDPNFALPPLPKLAPTKPGICLPSLLGRICGVKVRINDSSIVYQFLGIPYAKPISRKSRFSLSLPPDSFKNMVFNASTPANACPQLGFMSNEVKGGEDCLQLNIHVPESIFTADGEQIHGPSNLVPVIVFIHGGGYRIGEASSFDGAELSHHGGLIVVTINYRLSMFGFGYLPETPLIGNVGLMDQRLALEWVKTNIGAFGGDMDRVTLMGQSAGAGSVSAHIAAPGSLLLYKNAITESGSIWCQATMKRNDFVANITRSVAALAGCVNATDQAIFACMENQETDSLLRAYDNYLEEEPDRKENLLCPIEDDALFFSGNAHTQQDKMNYSGHSYLMGTATNEGLFLLKMTMRDLIEHKKNLTKEAYFEKFGPEVNYNLIGLPSGSSILNDTLAFYAPPRNSEYFMGLVQLLSDYKFRCCAGPNAISAVAKTADNAYLFAFNHSVAWDPRSAGFGATHGAELDFVFGKILNEEKATVEEGDLSLQMMHFWANFAKTGKPTNDDTIWPPVSADWKNAGFATKVLDTGEQPVESRFKIEECAEWETIYSLMPAEKRNFIPITFQ